MTTIALRPSLGSRGSNSSLSSASSSSTLPSRVRISVSTIAFMSGSLSPAIKPRASSSSVVVDRSARHASTTGFSSAYLRPASRVAPITRRGDVRQPGFELVELLFDISQLLEHGLRLRAAREFAVRPGGAAK